VRERVERRDLTQLKGEGKRPLAAVGSARCDEARADEEQELARRAVDLLADDVVSGERPGLHPDLIRRTALLEWFSAHRTESVVAMFAGAGYGKTTLLAQAAQADARPFAWVSLEERDNDPLVLVTHLARGLDELDGIGDQPGRIGRPEAEILGSGPGDAWSEAVPRLGAALASTSRPLVLVLDDVHVLGDPECLNIVASLCACVGDGSQVILAGRAAPDVGLSRLRAERRLAELDRDRLALDPIEAGALLSAAGVDLPAAAIAELTERTEGWAVGLYLIALSLHGAEAAWSGRAESGVVGHDPHVSDYLRSEVLSRLEDEEVGFLARTSVLGCMSGPLCDAVLERTSSAAMLASLARASGFVVPLETDGWYRQHYMFRELLADELEQREPDVIRALNHRAAVWSEQNDRPQDGVEYALAGGDLEHAATLLTACGLEIKQSGQVERLREWVDRLDQPAVLERHPEIAILGAWAHGLSGHPAQAERWANVAERIASDQPRADGASIEPWEATLRASRCRHGVERMRADAERALELTPGWSPGRSTASLLFGISLVLCGDADAADDMFAETVELAQEMGMHGDRSMALAERSLLAAERGDVRRAGRFADQAGAVVLDAGLDEYMPSAITHVAQGRAALLRRDRAGARDAFARADQLRPLLTRFMPSLALQVRLELLRGCLGLAEPAGARALLGEIDQLLRRMPTRGVLADEVAELRERFEALRTLSGDEALLTAAELRVLPLLATHLSIGEIAERQYVSRATVKTQAIAIYRKLAVTCRGDAVERAAELGLIDSAAVPPKRDFRPSEAHIPAAA
jgi:LuxR family transcriptional regulator, maltose regulon positive regulatory protein